MKTLDALLFQWVGEPDELRAEGAFRSYYAAAFPLLARHVQHRTGWDPASAEDIAQEGVLRFFERAGRGRREALALVRAAATELIASERCPPHAGPAISWARAVIALVGSMAELRLPSDGHWRAAAAESWVQILSLESAGWRLIDDARRKLQWGSVESGNGAHSSAAPPTGSAAVGSADPDACEVGGFARRLRHEYSLNSSHAANAEARYPGVGRLVETVLTVVETLPRLRLPTNGYLFEIATTLFLDEIKRRRRWKRGGMQDHVPVHEATSQGIGDTTVHPVDAVPDERGSDLQEGIWLDPSPLLESRAAPSLPSGADPVEGYESEEFLHRFYEYLRSPLTRAVRALEEARGRGEALSAQCRVESVSRKFSRMMAVLSMMGEGYTQEEIARRATMSRNQVKYIVETVKEAYARFTADKACVRYASVTREGEADVS